MKPGDVVSGRFVLERVAGAGGMGVVYRALDRATGQPVALKILHGHGAEHTERFAREAQLLSSLSHPGIVRYVGHGTTEAGEGYMAMEWLEGESLGDRLKRQPLAFAETMTLALRAASALAVAHQRGIVHRDVKPANVFLPHAAVETTKILDFGIARLLEPGQTLTLTGAMLGTPGYMPPEQARGQRTVDARADVYALGCVLFKCFTGRLPFEGEPMEVLMRVVGEEPPRARALRPELPPALDDLLARTIARAPDLRPRDAAQLAAELHALAQTGMLHGAPALPPTIVTSSGGWVPPPSSAAAPGMTPPTVVTGRTPALQTAATAPRGAGALIAIAALGGGLVVALVAIGFLALKPAGDPSPTSCPFVKCVAANLDDATRVDALDVLPRARALAQNVDGRARFSQVTVMSARQGVADLTKGGNVNYEFIVPNEPAIHVIVRAKEIDVQRGYAMFSVVPEPRCSSAKAWAAAVAAGLPREIAVTIDYRAQTDTDNRPSWTFAAETVDSHVFVDGQTCAVIRR